MSRNRAWLARLLLAVLLVVGLGGAIAWLGQRRDERALDLARGELNALLSSPASERAGYAQRCVRLCEPLLARDGRVGAAAALFVRSAAPFAELDAKPLPIPPLADVRQLPVADLLLVVKLLILSGRVAPADQLLDVLLEHQGPERAEVLRLAAELRVGLGRDQEVLAYCRELETLSGEDPYPHRLRARVYRTHSRWQLFVDAAREALKRSEEPEDELRVGIVEALLLQGLTTEARQEFDALVRQRPELGRRAPTVVARLLIQESKLQEAEQVLKDFLQESPEDAEALILLGSVLVSREDFQAAVPILEKAVDRARSEEKAHYLLSQAYARTGQPDMAKESLAWHRLILDTKVRLQALERQAAREPRNVEVRKELVEEYEKIGLRDLADFWRRALATAQE
jgi:tetratricopeptide (TPR) repeat protein